MLRTRRLHSGWEFACKSWLEPPGKIGFSTAEWLPATVPGHVHLDLVREGVIADPFTRMNELGCQWVDERDWVYRTRFDFVADPALPRRQLCFDGLDTVCSIRLNGELVAEHDNMFVPLAVDVSRQLRPGANELEIEFSSAQRTGLERRARYLAAEGLPQHVTRFDDRAFVRKAQYMFGWDWGPRLVSAGVWGKVELVEFRARFRDVGATQKHLPDGSVELVFRSEIDGEGEVYHLVEGADRPLYDGETLVIREPKLWWPAGLGAQNQYFVESVLVPRGSDLHALEGRALDRRMQRIGLRTIRLVREDDHHGQSFEFEVNSRRFFALGANWIPDSSFPAELSRERVFAQVERARDMNMNMLRVWGGGLYESEDFYDATDALGVLVWQDFPYACSYYPDDSEARAVALREAESAVRRLRNRASLAIWCGNNENLTMFESKWGEPSHHPPRYYAQAIYERDLPDVLAKLDPARPYIPTSPWGGPLSNGDGVGDQHYWDVWHGRGDWKYYSDSRARFVSEFGFAAAPGHAAFRRIASHASDPLALDVRDAAARWHDKTAKGYETFVGYVELHYPVARTIEEWIYTSQLNQRDALRFGIEHYRRSDFCKGCLIWQLNDCWPVQSWAVLDSELEYKAAAYELRRLYANALVSVQIEGARARIWTLLDNGIEAVTDRVVVEVRSTLDGELLGRFETAVSLAPGERKLALEVDLKAYQRDSSILTAAFAGSSTFRLLAEPKEMRLGAPRLEAVFVEGGILLQSDTPVVDLFVWDPAGGVRFDPNYVTLPAAGSLFLRTSGSVAPSRAPRQQDGRLCGRSLRGPHSIELSNLGR